MLYRNESILLKDKLTRCDDIAIHAKQNSPVLKDSKTLQILKNRPITSPVKQQPSKSKEKPKIEQDKIDSYRNSSSRQKSNTPPKYLKQIDLSNPLYKESYSYAKSSLIHKKKQEKLNGIY